MSYSTIKNQVKNHRHELPRPNFSTLDSVKDYPNNYYLELLIEELSLDISDIKYVLTNLKDAQGMSDEIYANQEDNIHLQYRAFPFMNKGDFFVGSVYDLHFVGSKKPEKFTFPNGSVINYTLLFDEVNANVSVLDQGFSTVDNQEIFIRQNHLNWFAAYSELKGVFGIDPVPMIIAHELSHYYKDDYLVDELLVERRAEQFLLQNNFSIKDYFNYHILRATKKDITGENISEKIIKKTSLH